MLKSHGLRTHPLYSIWRNVKERCFSVKCISYHNYGGRGITMCNEWKNDFVLFYNWCIENGWRPGLEIDRRDNNGNYEPSNCRFVTRKQNSNNTRRNRFIAHKGEILTISQWAERFNIDSHVIAKRLKCGWNVEDAITKKTETKRIVCLNNNITYKSAAAAGRALGCGKTYVGYVCQGKIKHSKGLLFKYA